MKLFNLISLFKKKKPEPVKENKGSEYDVHEQQLVKKVISLLQAQPHTFSARWFTGSALDKSVRSKNNEILIMIDTGQIIRPIEPAMSKQQQELVKLLIQPIVKKDSYYLIQRLVSEK